MFDFFHEISQTLSHNKLRTFLTGIAVAWGIFMLIVLLSMARGVTNSFNDNMMKGNNTILRLWSGRTTIPYKGNREGRWIEFEEKDLKTIPSKNPEFVENVSSRIDLSGTISSPDGKISKGYAGVYPGKGLTPRNGKLTQGRDLTRRDMDERAKVMVISKNSASKLFPHNDTEAIGKRVICNGLSFLIVGIYESDWNDDVYIPFSTARMMNAKKSDLGNLTVDLKNVKTEEDGNAAEAGVRNTLAKSHNFDPDDSNAVYISNYFTGALTAKKGLSILDTAVWVLGILTLLTGIVGVSNIMFVTVKERTHEIGIRRAIGAKPSKILSQIIAESVAITLTFGYIGIVLGTVVTQIIAVVIGEDGPIKNPTVSLTIAFEVTAVLIIAGMLAGLFPALKALKVKPVEALRDE